MAGPRFIEPQDPKTTYSGREFRILGQLWEFSTAQMRIEVRHTYPPAAFDIILDGGNQITTLSFNSLGQFVQVGIEYKPKDSALSPVVMRYTTLNPEV